MAETATSATSAARIPNFRPLASVASSDRNVYIREILSFKGCEHICRATSISKVQRAAGRIFATSAGSAKTWGMSSPAECMNTFLSHTWSTNRYLKWLALLYHFNLRGPGCLIVLYLFLYAMLVWLKLVPKSDTHSMTSDLALVFDTPPSIGWVARNTTVPVFLFFVCFWWKFVAVVNKIMSMITRKGFPIGIAVPTVFLDKVCIHQDDPDLMQQGIRKLAAFVKVSDEMLIILSDQYMTRLWTIYEIAASLAVHNTERMQVLLTTTPVIFFVMLTASYIANPMHLVTMKLFDLPFLAPVVHVLSFGGAAYFLRLSAQQRKKIESDLRWFSVRNCRCAKESDRELVYENIRQLMVASNLAHRDAPRELALTAFDNFVRTALVKVLRDSLGAFTLPYWTLALIGFLSEASRALDEFVAVRDDSITFEIYVLFAVMKMNFSFAIFPLAFALLEIMLSRFPHLQGWRVCLYIVFCVVVVQIGAGVIVLFDDFKFYAAVALRFDYSLTMMIATSAAEFTLTYLVYSGVFSRTPNEISQKMDYEPN